MLKPPAPWILSFLTCEVETDEKVTFSAPPLPAHVVRAALECHTGEAEGAQTSPQSWQPGEGHLGQ